MTTRRIFIAVAAGLAAPAFAAGANAQSSGSAETTGPALSKDQVGYQDVPRQGKVCAQCVYFIFAQAASAAPSSRCKLVAGPISPAGWCEVWAPR